LKSISSRVSLLSVKSSFSELENNIDVKIVVCVGVVLIVVVVVVVVDVVDFVVVVVL
jgi:hypothetical protein